MRQVFTSKTIFAVLIFGIVSTLLGLSQFCQVRPANFPYLSWTAWAIRDFISREQAPEIVFLGSSLMLVPLDGVDADYLEHRIDGSQHHRSCYFEDTFQQKTGYCPTTFNFALPGEMPSDAYMITNFLLNGNRRPQMIVYGVGPRDFMDNLLPSPAATDPYRLLSRFGDVSADAGRMMPQWVDRLSYELGRLFWIYGHREDLASGSIKIVSKNAQQLVATVSPKEFNFDERRQILPEYRPFELLPGQAFFRPSTAADWKNFADNLDEYRKRYKRLKWETFLTQMDFFAKTLGIAKQRDISAVVVAMPLTDLNRSLLSDFDWNLYKTSLKSVAAANGATFIDLSESKDFSIADFGDTVHLHSGGGKRLLDAVAQRLSTQASPRLALGLDEKPSLNDEHKNKHKSEKVEFAQKIELDPPIPKAGAKWQ